MQYPLSFAQLRLWLIGQLAPNNPLYNVPITMPLQGEINSRALQEAINNLIARHEILRTNFIYQGVEPYQAIQNHLEITMELIDLSLSIGKIKNRNLKKIFKTQAMTSFDLQKDPLIRVKLIKLQPRHFILLFTLHHIIIDGWSVNIFCNELSEFYNALVEKRTPRVIGLTWQYANFSVWQRNYLQETGETYPKLLNYWVKKLKDVTSFLKLATDFPRPVAQSHRGNQISFSLSYELTQQLKKFSQENQSTLFMTLLAAFYTLLFRYTQQENIVVGSPIANRTPQETEQLIGFFVNTMALSANLSADLSFKDLLLQIKQTTLEAFDHQDFPFEHLLHHLQVERSLAHEPLCQVMFVLQNATENPQLTLTGITAERISFQYPIAKFDLLLSFEERDGQLHGFFEYATDLFKKLTIARMQQHLCNLLTDILAHSYKPLAQLNMLSSPEIKQVLYNWNKTQRDYPNQLLHEMFVQQVAKTPNKVAVVFKHEQLTYYELNAKANQLAHYLQKLGVTPDTMIAIACERSVEMVVGILGILKAGGACVPLDPTYPAERIRFILEDTYVSILLTQQTVLNSLPPLNIKLILLDQEKETFSHYPTSEPVSDVQPCHLAYVIYTSGSTGKPKGVMIEHNSVCNCLICFQDHWPLSLQDTCLHQFSFGFDAAVASLWWPLLNGVVVVMPLQEELSDSNYLIQLILKYKVTILYLTPSSMENLFDPLKTQQNLYIHTIILGGESLLQETVHRFEEIKDCNFYNVYGPTECTIIATSYAIITSHARSYPGHIIPLGKPLANNQIYILDRTLRPCPIGVVGELYIGGIGLARGYLNRPELTSKSFIPNPFQTSENKLRNINSRLYRTGDLGRWLDDGTIEFYGRTDDQVKIRGFRIEPKEIEAVLLQHDDIQGALVIARKDFPQDIKLVAYLVFKMSNKNVEQVKDKLTAIKSYLQNIFPGYMIPAAFLTITAIPLTHNGKVDYRKLPAPNFNNQDTFILPENDFEKACTKIWQSLLKITKFGIHDSFFDLGGHSLLAMQVVSRVHSQFGIEISLKDFFKKPRIFDLAELISKAVGQKITKNFLPIVSVPREGKTPLSFAQERLWFFEQIAPKAALYNVPLAIKLVGTIQLSALQTALNKLIARHEVLRTIFPIERGQPHQKIQKPFAVNVSEIDFSTIKKRMGVTLREYINKESTTPFSLTDGPLMKVLLFKLKKQSYIFSVIFHHIIIDEWSIRLFYEELAEFYNAAVDQRAAQITPLPLQYADFSIWQRDYLQETDRTYQYLLNYWVKQLAGVEKILKLPTDFPRPVALSYKCEEVFFVLSSELTQQLKNLGEAVQGTLFMTLLSAFYVLLFRYTHQDNFIVGSPIANRNRQETEALMGFFVNTLALRADLTAELSFEDLLSQVKKTTLEAFDHQDFPFEQLVQYLNVERSLAWAPIFQVMFVLQEAAESQLNLTGITANNISFKYPISNFDLTLKFKEKDGRLQGSFEYATDLFCKLTIDRMRLHFCNLLADIAIYPRKPLAQLNMLSADERQQILHGWNNTQQDYPKQTLHEMFVQQVEKMPDLVAVISANEQLTYRQLNAKSNQLAHYLQHLDVKPETLIALACERSVAMIIAILAILKSGGAYVPLDVNSPVERLHVILKETKAHILLTQKTVVNRLSLPDNIKPVLLDQEQKIFSHYPIFDPVTAAQPSHLAYIIYTSGSTGTPKGVMVEHGSVVCLTQGLQDLYTLGMSETMLVQSPINFDVSVEEIFWPLLFGGTLVLAPADIHQHFNELPALIVKHNVNNIEFVPSLLEIFCEQPQSKNCTSLHRIIVGGEVLPVKTRNLVLKTLPWVELYNTYGPTEAVVNAIKDRCYIDEQVNVPLGYPMPNKKVYILNKLHEIAGIGVVGELFLGGKALARGYLNRPELTKENFINNPFQSESEKVKGVNDQLYKTGDLCRWLADGRIEYIGRCDRQVKIRGFRIELGEIEATLSQYDKVTHAMVMVADKGDKELIAYIVFKQAISKKEENAEFDALTYFLRTRLPHYMIPAIFMSLDFIPLTANEKVDYKNLPMPQFQTNNLSYIAPRNETEKVLYKIWQSILKVKNLSIHDNFFAVGGNSLNLIRIVAKMQSLFSRTINVKDLYAAPTIAQQAEALNAVAEVVEPEPHQHILTLNTLGSAIPLFLIHPGGGLSYCYHSLKEYLPDIPFYSINHPTLSDPKISFTNLEQMATYYIKMIKDMNPQGKFQLGGWSFGGLVAYEIASQLFQQGEQIENLLLIDTYHPQFISPSEKTHSMDETEKEIKKFLLASGINAGSAMGKAIKAIYSSVEELQVNYKPKVYEGQTSLLKGLPVSNNLDHPSNGWSHKELPKLQTSTISVEHDNLFDSEHAEKVASWVKTQLTI